MHVELTSVKSMQQCSFVLFVKINIYFLLSRSRTSCGSSGYCVIATSCGCCGDDSNSSGATKVST